MIKMFKKLFFGVAYRTDKTQAAYSLFYQQCSRTACLTMLIMNLLSLAYSPFAQANALSPSDKQNVSIKPVILHHLGGSNFDQSFGQAIAMGAEKFKKEFGIPVRDFEPQNDAQLEQAVQKFIREGYSPIIAAGFTYETIINKMAPKAPNTKFVIVDTRVQHPNVQSLMFKDEEGSFLVGLLAAQASKTGIIGFIGGMDTPFIRRFSCGYRQGARYANQQIHVIENMIGSTPSAWNDPVKGTELARNQMDQGADVIYHAAGASGAGVLRAVADAKRLGIGIDTNQNGLFPGHVLTSMLKRLDTATYTTLRAAHQGTWEGGVLELGVKDNGVDWAFDDNNASLITPFMKASAEEAASKIRSGELKVHNFLSSNACPS
jgi:basic membrane protein A